MPEVLGHLSRNVDLDVFVEPPPRAAEQEGVRLEEHTRMRLGAC
jgi:hypothetical protein